MTAELDASNRSSHDLAEHSDASARSSDTRSRLLTAALALIDEIGYDNVKVTEIAKRAGLTTGALYWNFSDRDELLAFALMSRLHAWSTVQNARFDAFVSEAIRNGGSTPFLELLGGPVSESARRDRIRVAHASLKYPRVLEAAEQYVAQQRRVAESNIVRLQDAGVLSAEVSAEVTSFFVHVLVTGLQTHGVAASDMPDPAALVNFLARVGQLFRS